MSPPLTGADRAAAARRSLGSTGAAIILYLLPVPLLGKALYELAWHGRFAGFALSLALFTLFILGAELARRGVAKSWDFRDRKVARAGGAPLKALGGGVIAGATFLTAWMAAGQSLPAAIGIGLGALLGFFLTYGLDAYGEKGVDANSGVSVLDVQTALADARTRIAAIEATGKRLSGPTAYELRQKLRDVVAAAGKVLHLIEEDPRDLRRARKFLNVYLESARTVAENYANTSAKAPSPEMEAKFRAVLDDLKATCEEQYQKLLENDTLDLDAQIEVLKLRLTREGLS
ncbi:MAG: 5-bromo-4-chloroindolyl phosphate hydrolysis family protein [Rhodospirillaceae bacterium]|nr:5-bromo-4-chloroindolyl phosphate hydrolysis family protein [Rhodospirillaceae bacterium]